MTVPGKKTTVTRPRDASMSLLNELFTQPLEPGYEQAAARRRQADDAAEPRRTSVALVLGMLTLGLLFAVALLQAQNSATFVSAEREGLIERIESAKEQSVRLRETRAELQSETTELEDTYLQSTASGQQLRNRLQQLSGAAGTIPVSGPGVAVVLNDPESVDSSDDSEPRVIDWDVRLVVNGLWAAGAEAISINGERLTALSAIRMANGITHVNQQPLNAPFVVSAVGDSQSLPAEFSDGPTGVHLRWLATEYGIRYTVRLEESLELPAANPDLLYARNAEEAS